MNRSHLRNLFLSNFFLLFIVTGCSPLRGYKKQGAVTVNETLVQPLISKTGFLLYKAKIDLYNKSYSGLIILKETQPGVSHLTFITEVGMKIFDYEIRQNDFMLMYIFAPLDKPRTKAILEHDMKLLLLHPLFQSESISYQKNTSKIYYQKKNRHLYFVAGNGKTIDRVIIKGPLFKKQEQIYCYNDSLHAQKIILKHLGFFRLRMEFNKINKANP